jgi:spore coat polysaccharide biosynthesis protein SpsF
MTSEVQAGGPLAVVCQARMSSSRLPGKVLWPVAGRPALQYLVERLERATRPDLIVVATSVESSDDPIAAFCERLDLDCHRGPLEDVAERFREVVERWSLSAFVRVTGDSPLLDPRLVDHAVELYAEGGTGVVTNVFPSTFPSGQSVEVVGADAFRQAYELMETAYDHEHVTPYLYRHHERFGVRNFRAERDLSGLDVSVDTSEDAALIDAIVARMERPHWEYGWEDVVRLSREVSAGASR